MNKVNVVGIAPFNGLKLSMDSVAEQHDTITFSSYIGDLDAAVAVAQTLDPTEVDVIISRGGTALLLKEKINIPVVEINISVYDILRSIRLSQNFNGKSAVVGYRNITDRANVLKDLLSLDIEVISVDKPSSVFPLLNSLKTNGYTTVISDQVTSDIARDIGLHAILITSVEETISKSFEQALSIGRTRLKMKQHNKILRKVNENNPVQLLIYTEDNVWIEEFSSHTLPNKIRQKIENTLVENSNTTILTFNETYNGKIYSIKQEHIFIDNSTYTIFFVTVNEILAPSNKAIALKTVTLDAQEKNEILFNSSLSVDNELKQVKNYAESNEVIFLIGEHGTYKDKLAELFSESSSKTRFWEINCEHITKSEWQALLKSLDSPFQDEKATIYLKEVTHLGSKEINKLLTYAKDSLLFNRNKLILSSTLSLEESSQDIVALFDNWPIIFYATSILRERKANIPALASLYINEFNNQYGKHIIGFEPNALERLMKFDWPANQVQFKRVIKQLVIQSSGAYIKDKDTRELLKNELKEASNFSAGFLQLDQTLEEINYDIIQMVMKEENGNKSKTADRLGISRSTLWRLLNKFE